MTDEFDPRSKPPAWKRVWRFVFWPFYRHFDVLHHEIKELKWNLQSMRGLQDEGRNKLRDAIQLLEQQQTLALKANRNQLDEFITHNAAIEQRWQGHLAELLSRQEEFTQNAAKRADGLDSRLEKLHGAIHETRLQSGELVRGLDQLRLETRPRLHQLTLELEQIRIAASLSEQTLTARLEDALIRSTSQDQQWRSHAAEQKAVLDASLEAATIRVGETADKLNSGLRSLQGEVRDLSTELDRINDPVGSRFNYTAFENRFRGPEATIRKWQSIYLPLLQKHQPVVDLGCGRGELLEILKEEGIKATGVDNNPDQVSRCREKGLRVVKGEVLQWLASQPPTSIGAITLLQVIEHFRLNEAQSLITEASRVLKPGGILLMETVNPHCPEALEWFYIDPTHIRPVYPEMLEFLLLESGYRDITIRYQNPSPANASAEPPTPKTGADFSIWGTKP